MIEGQMMDIAAEGMPVDMAYMQKTHRRKTATFMAAAIKCGAIAAGATKDVSLVLEKFAQTLGLLFQVVDDILDVTRTSEELGKDAGSDIANDKTTYVTMLGLQGAQQEAQKLHREAKELLTTLPYDTSILNAVCEYVIARTS